MMLLPSAGASVPEVAESAVDEWPAVECPRERPVVGEQLSFQGRWFGLPVGRGWIKVQDLSRLDGRMVYHIQAEGHSNELLSAFYPIHDILDSYFDAESFRPLRFEKHQREGRYQADEVVDFDYQRGLATYRSLLNGSVKEIPIPDDVHDIISVFYWLRSQPIQPRQPIMAHIYSDEKVYQAQLQPHNPVMLELLRRGTFSCLVFEPIAALKGILVRRGRIWLYVTSDERRMPVFAKITTPWGPITGILDAQSMRPVVEPVSVASDAEAGKE